MEVIKVLAFIVFGVSITQLYVYFSLREFWKDNDGVEQCVTLKKWSKPMRSRL